MAAANRSASRQRRKRAAQPTIPRSANCAGCCARCSLRVVARPLRRILRAHRERRMACQDEAREASEVWWTAGGSNSRPPRCERGALPTELAAHFSKRQLYHENLPATLDAMRPITRIGVLTGGGDAPGLNPGIPPVVKAASNSGTQCVGLEDSFDGLIEPDRSRVLTPRHVTGILRLGGTVLGTTNRGNPFAYPVTTSEGTRDYSTRVVEMFHKMKLGALVVIGGDGTLAIAHQFGQLGIPLVGVPKTIDNDIVGTTNCFGFDTAVAFATDAIDRLHTTAEAHKRILVVEVMGRYAGWIALYAGVAGGADAILIPEIPFDLSIVAERLRYRDRWGAKFSIVVVAE